MSKPAGGARGPTVRLNLAARRSPKKQKQEVDVVQDQIVLVQLGDQIHVVGQVLLEPLIGEADAGEDAPWTRS